MKIHTFTMGVLSRKKRSIFGQPFFLGARVYLGGKWTDNEQREHTAWVGITYIKIQKKRGRNLRREYIRKLDRGMYSKPTKFFRVRFENCFENHNTYPVLRCFETSVTQINFILGLYVIKMIFGLKNNMVIKSRSINKITRKCMLRFGEIHVNKISCKFMRFSNRLE